jgi:hypothetical protein
MCEFEADVATFDDIDGAVWECPREPATGRYCLFHSREPTPTATATEQLIETVEAADGAVRLIGARIEGLDLDYATIDADRTYPIDLRSATVTGELTARHAHIAHPLRLDGALVEGGIVLDDAVFTQRVGLDGAELRGPFSAQVTQFDSLVRLYGTVFGAVEARDDSPGTAHDLPAVDRPRQSPTVAGGAAVFARGAVFEQGLYAERATFGDAADFMNVQFSEVGNFIDCAFAAGAVFARSNFEDNLNLTGAWLDAPTTELQSKLGGSNGVEHGRTLDGVALHCEGITCRTSILLDETRLGGDVRLWNVTLDRDLDTTGATATAAAVTVDCRETDTVTGLLGGDGLTYSLTGATLGETELVGIEFTALRFDNTTFDGFDFGEYKQQLRATDWQLHDETMSPTERENLYLLAKNGANGIGDDGAAAQFFIREMTARGASHREQLTSAGGLRPLVNLLGNLTLRGTCGYGERPSYTVGFSAVIISVFTVGYAIAGVGAPYSGPDGLVTFSVQAFVSALLSNPTPANQTAALLVAVEGFLGGFMIALFVFTLTRSINR